MDREVADRRQRAETRFSSRQRCRPFHHRWQRRQGLTRGNRRQTQKNHGKKHGWTRPTLLVARHNSNLVRPRRRLCQSPNGSSFASSRHQTSGEDETIGKNRNTDSASVIFRLPDIFRTLQSISLRPPPSFHHQESEPRRSKDRSSGSGPRPPMPGSRRSHRSGRRKVTPRPLLNRDEGRRCSQTTHRSDSGAGQLSRELQSSSSGCCFSRLSSCLAR